jgi:hypothetical protein
MQCNGLQMFNELRESMEKCRLSLNPEGGSQIDTRLWSQAGFHTPVPSTLIHLTQIEITRYFSNVINYL